MNKRKFSELGLDRDLLKAIDAMGYEYLTEVQEKAIPTVLDGGDLVVKSQTGSGKTAAFAIPICNEVEWEERDPQALVIVPTRELAMQVRKEFFTLGRFRRLKSVEIYGKAPYGRQQRELKERAHVVVGTPGRIIDHIERGNLKTQNIKYLVLDESDEMLNMGFLSQVETIMESLPEDRTNLLFSATMPTDIRKLTRKYMDKPKFIEIKSDNSTMDRIEQIRYEVEKKEKIDLLMDLTVVENPDNCIIFCNTRGDVDFVHKSLKKKNYPCDKIHGGMEQRDRTKVMKAFKSGKFRYLIATDVAARGIDVEDITHVINYDVPREEEPYVHRIGRTGRKGKTGKAITFCTKRDKKHLKDIMRYTKTDIKLLERPSNNVVESNISDFKVKMKKETVEKKPEVNKLNSGILKLHINAGKKQKMRAGDIVGAICSINGVDGDDIGVINVIDVSTFVEILNDKGKMVLDAFKDTKIKGRMRSVNIARR